MANRNKRHNQFDLFVWADKQPTAEVLDFMRPLSLAIQRDPDRFDPIVPKPHYEDNVVEWPGRVCTG